MQKNTPTKNRFVRWMKLDLYAGSREELVELVSNHLVAKKAGLLKIATPNPEQVMLARTSPEFQATLERMDLLLPDGVGLSASASLAGHSLQRIPGRVFLIDLLEKCTDSKTPVLFLGGQKGVAERAKTQVLLALPRLPLFALQGPADLERASEKELASIFELIHEFEIRVVCVAFGAPKQERWILEHAERLEKAGVRCALTIGGALDVLAGEVSQPPVIVSSLGVEWLWRLWHQPWRLQRQLRLIPFAFFAINEIVRSRFGQK